MNKRRYLVALAVFFLIGCAAALGLRAYDVKHDTPAPVEEAHVFDIPEGGFTLAAPPTFGMTEYEPTGSILFSGMLSDGQQTLLLYCYANENGDAITDYTDQALVTYYTNAGCSDVRMRTLGERRFVCYSAQAQAEGGTQTWYVYQTWDESSQLVFETQLAPDDALSILATLSFAAPAAGI